MHRMTTPILRSFVLPAALILATAACARGQGRVKQPVYVGVKVCASCHDGDAAGNQCSLWLKTKHARTYSHLATPEARQIAKWSGIPMEPAKSAMCLGCHATGAEAEDWEKDPTFFEKDGVQCEKCHGPGSEYADAKVMADRKAAVAAGLNLPTQNDCLHCHAEKGSHKIVLGPRPFDFDKAWSQIAHPIPGRGKPVGHPAATETVAPSPVTPIPEVEPRYKTPLNLAMSPDGKELYVTCEAAYSVVVVDVASRRKVAEIPVGGHPMNVTFSPDGRRVFVSNRLDDSVSVIDPAARKTVATVPVGDEPHGLMTDRSGKTLYVLNTSSDDISVIDTASWAEVKRLAASRSPWAMAPSPDGSRIYVTNSLSRFVKFREPPLSEVTVLDTQRAVVDDRVPVPATNLLQGIAWHPDGRFALTTMLRTKNLVPLTRLLQGWTITNGLAVLWADGRVDQVLLDEPGVCFPDPAAVAITPDGRLALVTSSSTDRVAVADLAKLVGLLQRATPYDREHVLPNHLGSATEFVIAHIPTKNGPRGILIAPDGKTAFVANSLDDSLTVIDVPSLRAVERIDLGGPKEITKTRYGERLFNSAKITFRRQFSCHSCHPDGHIDGLTYDIESDGIGMNPVDNRTLRGILDTAPFKWSGTNPSLSRQCGARLAAHFTRLAPFSPEELAALDSYICTIPRPPNRYRPVGAPLTEAQRRGKAIFMRTRANDGRVIPKENRCTTCHFPPLYTDRQLHDVGTRHALDTISKFDVPHLNNIYDSAPYLHNGMANTLEEIWTRYNAYDTHGVTNDMTKDQLNDLIEYLKTL